MISPSIHDDESVIPYAFDLSISNEQYIYPGSKLSGHVVARLAKDLEIATVCVTLRGTSKVQFSKKKPDLGKDVSNAYSKENFQKYENTIIVIHKEFEVCRPDKKITDTKAGAYSWPFSFTLPKNAPISFAGLKGKIKYSISLSATVPGYQKTPNFTLKKQIKVIPFVDAKTIDFQKEQATLTKLFAAEAAVTGKKKSKETAGKIKLEFVLSKNIYFLKDYINFKIKVHNFTAEKRAAAVHILVRQDTEYIGKIQDGVDKNGLSKFVVYKQLDSKIIAENKDELPNIKGADITFEGMLEFANARPDFKYVKGNIQAKTVVVIEIIPGEGQQFNERVMFEVPITITAVESNATMPSTFKQKTGGCCGKKK
uniref:Arrestin_N domain-containing protein n=1 Tax=Rhabditophanes sp. KR3021 TaxID=114890 RepID=A0AC35TPL4_9BILA